MKDSLEKNTVAELIRYRMQRARETLVEAQYNAKGGYFNAAVNRLYYACFYAALALMLSEGIEANTHKGVKVMLALHFINQGKMDKKFGSYYQQLFNNRQAGDYEDFVYCDNELYTDLYPKAEAFVSNISSLLNPAEPDI